MATDYISYLPVDNADSILIKVGHKSVLTDINYCKDADFDIKPAIKSACSNSKLDYFVLTHPDQDHVRGFDDIFHRGKPDLWDSAKFILVKTIICTQYAIDLTNPTGIAKDLINEIRRRNRLTGDDRDVDGNRIEIVGDGDTIKVNDRLKGYVLSPSQTELDAADPKGEDDKEVNNTSAVIHWEYQKDGGNKSHILLGGDCGHEVWARLNEDEDDSRLEWDLITAPHHCSLTPFAYKENGEYIDDDDAIAALSHRKGKSFVVSSSKPIKRDDDNPPHYKAKNKWIKILRISDSDSPELRFLCTATFDNGDKPGIVKFELNENGLKRFTTDTSSQSHKSVGLSSVTQYG